MANVILDKGARQVANNLVIPGKFPCLEKVLVSENEVVAYNGFSMVRRPVNPDAIKGFPYNPEVRLGGKDKVLVDTPYCLGDFKGYIEGKDASEYPDLESLYPKGEVKVGISFSVSLLKRLLSSLGNEEVIKMKIRGTWAGVEFVAGKTSGIIMPMSLDDKDWEEGNWKDE